MGAMAGMMAEGLSAGGRGARSFEDDVCERARHIVKQTNGYRQKERHTELQGVADPLARIAELVRMYTSHGRSLQQGARGPNYDLPAPCTPALSPPISREGNCTPRDLCRVKSSPAFSPPISRGHNPSSAPHDACRAKCSPALSPPIFKKGNPSCAPRDSCRVKGSPVLSPPIFREDNPSCAPRAGRDLQTVHDSVSPVTRLRNRMQLQFERSQQQAASMTAGPMSHSCVSSLRTPEDESPHSQAAATLHVRGKANTSIDHECSSVRANSEIDRRAFDAPRKLGCLKNGTLARQDISFQEAIGVGKRGGCEATTAEAPPVFEDELARIRAVAFHKKLDSLRFGSERGSTKPSYVRPT
ncbi:hypothetical protein DIPPA_64896 [Diplonema papillatum]|nr:hypothetical protein DIPPA_64896 [Diplonema papillatum]